jgi:hypothetical protein
MGIIYALMYSMRLSNSAQFDISVQGVGSINSFVTTSIRMRSATPSFFTMAYGHSHWIGFRETPYFRISTKNCRQKKISLKQDKNNRF